MRQITPQEAQQAMEKAFHHWGLPYRVRLDNGHPFARTADRGLPTNLVLWMVALGIEPIFNHPGTPQENGTVECLQGISHRWANPKSCSTTAQLQAHLDEVSFDHLEVYRIRAQNDATRKELYPELFEKQRIYHPQQLNLKNVSEYLAQFCWIRKIYTNGRFSFAGTLYSVGTRFKNKDAFIQFNPQTHTLEASLENGTVVYRSDPIALNKKNLINLNVFQRTSE